ncbi:MAG: hypothetical protein QM680_00240 [Luteolibacter sp.]
MIRMLWILWSLVPVAGAQDAGYVRLFHAVNHGTGKLQVCINREPVRPGGYSLGDMTGGISLSPGIYQIHFERDGVKTCKTQLTVHSGETTTLVAYAENGKDGWEIEVMRLKQQDAGDERWVSLVSVSCDLAVEIKQGNGRWSAVSLEKRKPRRFENGQASAYLALRNQGREFTTRSLGMSGHAVVIFYDDENGESRMKSFLDYAYGKTISQ